ncbi:NeuD/PglB/VioB family sugar acetyltransferase [Arthrobacter sp.]|uniref:NeuD/PglB/VioB family sugar acetyltransferase n=1 Tax=Arthrobacter sp. TaxID=1667 RepID=UPI0028A163A4|nr:NeuD/PglB/VioB family sugar acetyltransferase [Arthrobacter sp.]
MPALLLLAAGGLGREVLASLRLVNEYRIFGFLDDDATLPGSRVDGIPVLGGIADAGNYPRCRFLACAGSGTARAGIVETLERAGIGEERFATFLDPGVHLPEGCTVGTGSILLAGTVLTASVTVGRHVAVMPNSTLTHDNVLEDYCTLGAGVSLGGGVHVGTGAYLGMGASVRQGVRIGRGAVVGMASAVLTDVPDGQIWAGVPARPLRVHDADTAPAMAGTEPERTER